MMREREVVGSVFSGVLRHMRLKREREREFVTSLLSTSRHVPNEVISADVFVCVCARVSLTERHIKKRETSK